MFHDAWIRVSGVLVLFALQAWPVAGQPQAVPDFSGLWGRNAFNMEQPAVGPGPLANRRRVGADAARPIFDGDPVPLVGDYTNPILKPQAAELVRKWGEHSASGHDFPDPSNQCGTFSPPFVFSMMIGMQMLQGSDHITILYGQDHQVRHIRLNDSHPASVTLSPMGDSVGRYEGDTLVVDTTGVKLQPYTVADRFGTPQSEAMHTVERYRLIGGKEALDAQRRHEQTAGRVGGEASRTPLAADIGQGLQIEVTVEDANVFTAPWIGNVTLRRVAIPWEERVCAENNTDVLHQGFERVPTASKPDF